MVAGTSDSRLDEAAWWTGLVAGAHAKEKHLANNPTGRTLLVALSEDERTETVAEMTDDTTERPAVPLSVLISLLNTLAMHAAQHADNIDSRMAAVLAETYAAAGASGPPLSSAALRSVRSRSLLRWMGWCVPHLCAERGISLAALDASFNLHQREPVVKAAVQGLRALGSPKRARGLCRA
mmetsp:Transcript_40075/g.118947  ORF Transcript_40075/g.118947 Transcript_40075/m.118947 type:complete len:181 (-) Transcript_40075:274-816(-)